LGAFLIEPLNETVNNGLGTLGGGNARLFLFGGLLMAVVVFLPNGILPSLAAFLFRAAARARPGWSEPASRLAPAWSRCVSTSPSPRRAPPTPRRCWR
jgi:branched-chain amino acid transport system permease protein